VGNRYGCRESQKAEHLRHHLKNFKERFEEWVEEQKGQETGTPANGQELPT
jgi:hypothetical protein